MACAFSVIDVYPRPNFFLDNAGSTLIVIGPLYIPLLSWDIALSVIMITAFLMVVVEIIAFVQWPAILDLESSTGTISPEFRILLYRQFSTYTLKFRYPTSIGV